MVFLDVAADRYFALSGDSGDACRRLATKAPAASGDAVIVDDLIDRGILCRTVYTGHPELCPSPPVIRDQAEGHRMHGGIRRCAAAAARQVAAMCELRFGSLERVLGAVAAAKRRRVDHKEASTRPEQVAAAFAAVDRVISRRGLCLPRSLALARTLIADGADPLLILGVKLRPFEAHCWVQIGDRLIGDDAGNVAPFTPILIL